MSAAASRAGAAAAPTSATTKQKPSNDPWIDPVPMAPRRGLLVLLLCAFAAWMALLVGVYFTTAHSRGRPSSSPPVPAKPTPALARLPA